MVKYEQLKKCRQKISITPLEEKKKMLTKTIAYNKFESSPKSRILPKKVKFKCNVNMVQKPLKTGFSANSQKQNSLKIQFQIYLAQTDSFIREIERYMKKFQLPPGRKDKNANQKSEEFFHGWKL